MLRTQSVDQACDPGGPARPRLWTTALLAIVLCGLSAAASAPAVAQGGGQQVIPVDIGVIGMRSLSTIFPSMVYRPYDDLVVRPGGQAMGMGGAYTALATGPLAIGWSPAGLADMEGVQVVIDAYSTSSSSALGEYPDTIVVPQSPPLLISAYNVELKGGVEPGFAAVGAPLWGNGTQQLVGAVSWRRYHDVAMPEETVTDLTFGGENSFPVVISNDRVESGSVEAIAPSLALRILPGVSVGANLNFLTGRLRATATQQLATGGGNFDADTRLTFKYSGFAPDLGARIALWGGRLQAAVRYSPEYTLEVRGGNLSSATLPAPGTPQFVTTGRVSGYDLTVPAFLGGGVAFRPHSRLLLAAEVNQRKWSEAELTYTDTPEDGVSSPTESLPVEDLASLHFGAEYVVLRPDWGEIPVRAGYRTAPMSFRDVARGDVVVDSTLFPLLVVLPSGAYTGKEVDGTAFSLGASIETRNIDFDLGVEWLSYEFQKWFLDAPWDPIANPRMTLIDVDRSVTTLRLSATHRF